jgi:Leucine-rich repeat (LRR) protein
MLKPNVKNTPPCHNNPVREEEGSLVICDNEGSVDDGGSALSATNNNIDGGGFLSAVKKKHNSAMSLLSSAASFSSADTTPSRCNEAVFVFNDVTDVVESISRQNRLLSRLEREQRLKMSGLSLAGDGDGSEAATLTEATKSILNKAHKTLASYMTLHRVITADAISGKNSNQYMTCADMPYRHITTLSTRTNMIHMNIGDRGITRIAKVLVGNSLITDIILANARISSIGLNALSDAILYLPNLRYLDLSQNAICDIGAFSLGSALCGTSVLGDPAAVRKLTLAGNRITYKGAKHLIECTFSSSAVMYMK